MKKFLLPATTLLGATFLAASFHTHAGMLTEGDVKGYSAIGEYVNKVIPTKEIGLDITKDLFIQFTNTSDKNRTETFACNCIYGPYGDYHYLSDIPRYGSGTIQIPAFELAGGKEHLRIDGIQIEGFEGALRYAHYHYMFFQV